MLPPPVPGPDKHILLKHFIILDLTSTVSPSCAGAGSGAGPGAGSGAGPGAGPGAGLVCAPLLLRRFDVPVKPMDSSSSEEESEEESGKGGTCPFIFSGFSIFSDECVP